MRKLLWIALAGAACSLVAIADTLLPGPVRLPHPAYLLVFFGTLPVAGVLFFHAVKLGRHWPRQLLQTLPASVKTGVAVLGGLAIFHFAVMLPEASAKPAGPALVSAEVYENDAKFWRRFTSGNVLILYTVAAAGLFAIVRRQEGR